MSLYRVFIISFCLTVLALGVFLYSYFQALFDILQMVGEQPDIKPAEVFARLFTPVWLISLLVLVVASMLYRVLGIVFIVRNPNLDGGEKAMWVIGFVLLSFIAAIVFMAMASSRNLTSTETILPPKY